MEQTNLFLLMEYDACVFHELNDFHIAKTILAQLGPVVNVLGGVVLAHGLQEHIGANLLHKHFSLKDGEYILRRFEGRVAKMRPDRIDSQTGNVRPYLWQLAHGVRGKHFYPLEFVEYESHVLPEATKQFDMIANNDAFLRDFATCLWDSGLEDVFGIAALCSRYRTELRSGETMLETTDAVNRVLTLEPVEDALLDDRGMTETLWTFGLPSHGKE